MALPQPDVEGILNRRGYLAVGWGRLRLGGEGGADAFTTAAAAVVTTSSLMRSADSVFHSLPLLFFFLCSSSVCKHPAVALGYERSQWWQQSSEHRCDSFDFKTPSGLRTDGSTIIMFMLVLGGWDLGGSISSLHKYCDWYALGKLDKHDCHDNQRHNKVITSPCCSFKCHILS